MRINTDIYCELLKNIFFFLITILVSNAPSEALAETPLLISQPDFAADIDQPTVSKILRDKNGLLWIGTQQGLYRYDGLLFTRFDSKPDGKNYISHSDIRGIVETESDDLIIATFGGGLFQWNRYSNEFEKVSSTEDLNFNQIDFLIKTADDIIWIASKGRFLALSPNLQRVIYNSSNLNLESKIQKINGVSKLDDKKYLLASNKGLWLLELGNRNTLRKIEITGDSAVLYIQTDGHGSTYLGFKGGEFAKLSRDASHLTLTKKLLPREASTVSQFLISEDLLWIATDRGLYIANLDLDLISVLNESNSGISDNYITSIFRDGEIFWIGTIHGLNLLTRNYLEVYNNRQSNIHHEVLAFSATNESSLWIGTYDGLFEHELTTGGHSKFEAFLLPPLKDQRIMTLAAKDSELWIGFRANGVQILETDTRQLRSPDSDELDHAEVTKILVDNDGSMWIATYNQGLYRVVGDSVARIQSIPGASITILLQLQSGEILAASESHFYVSVNGQDDFRQIALKYPDSVASPLLLSLAEDTTGNLYFGTKDQGVFVWRHFSSAEPSAQLQYFGTEPDVRSATIYGILTDADDKLWASTQKGIIVLDPDGSLRFRLLKQDGLQANDFNFGAAYKDESGAMYFGGVRGYNKLDPPKLIVDYSPPELHLVSLEVPGEHYYIAGGREIDLLQLEHDDYFVTIAFSTLDFASTAAAQYRYMLEGFDRQWIENGGRKTATYTNLPPGEYTFRAEGSNSAGVWSDKGISLHLKVLPPFWKTTWAYGFYTVLFLLAVWGLKRIYDNYVIKERALEYAAEMVATADRVEDDLQEQLEVQDEIVQASYRHNQSLLDLIRDDIDRLGDKSAGINRHIDILAMLEECYFYQTDSLQADMHRFTNALTARALQTASVPVETITVINSVTTQLVPAELASPIALAMFELLDNSLKHAFTEMSGSAHYIEITLIASAPLGQEVPTYLLTVEDDGVGLSEDQAYSAPPNSGLSLVRLVAKRHSAELNIDGEGGTKVSLLFPAIVPEEDAS